MRLQNYFLVLLVFLLGCADNPADDHQYITLKIYHTNDIHSHLLPNAAGRGGLAYLSSVLKAVKEKEPEALIIDAGDFYKKGSLPAVKTGDQVTADILSQMPYYDLRIVGNNEAKVGMPTLIQWSKKKEHSPLLSANLVDSKGKTPFQPYYILKKAGLKIGIIGLAPQSTFEDENQSEYKITDPETALVPLIEKLRPEVDILILVSHLGFKIGIELVKKYKKLDLVVSGHSHFLSPDQKNLKEPIVVEAGEFGQQIGVVTLNYSKKEKKVSTSESTFWPIGTDFQKPDQKIKDVIEENYKKWAPDATQVIAHAKGEFSVINTFNPYEGSLCDWTADVFQKETISDVAIINRGMFRESIYSGSITNEGLILAFPYTDKMATFTISRSFLKAMLEDIISKELKKEGQFPFAFSGIQAKVINNSVKIDINSNKEKIKVAVPNYLVTHCESFFGPQSCPLENPHTFEDVRQTIRDDMFSKKEISPPALSRIVVGR